MTIAGVLFLALIDSINPSAIVVTIWLLSSAGARALVHVVVSGWQGRMLPSGNDWKACAGSPLRRLRAQPGIHERP